MAARTAAATAIACGARPINSGRSFSVRAVPIASALRPGLGAPPARAAKTRKCGDSPPSVPPDMTIATRSGTASAATPRRGASIADKADSA
jgi:hypothetical protein